MATELLVSVTSLASPGEGQKHRSSSNFGIPYVPSGTTGFTFKVIPTGAGGADAIRFNVYSDNPSGKDQIYWGGENIEAQVHNGYKTSDHINTVKDVLYIGDPSGAGSGFNVEIWANF